MVSGCDEKYIWIMLDEAMGKPLVYVKGTLTYYVPYGEKKCNISSKAFSGKLHLIPALTQIEVYGYNVFD